MLEKKNENMESLSKEIENFSTEIKDKNQIKVL